LDDVSGVYPIDFETPSGLQSYASNPSGNQDIWRGREEDRFNDIYSFNTISLNYNFGYRKNTRSIDEIAYGNDTRTVKEMTIITVNEKGDTLRIEQQVREDDAKETARIEQLDKEKKALDEEIALLEEQLEEVGELSETPEAPEVAVEVEEPETPTVDIVTEPETTTIDTKVETPETEVVITEPEVEIVMEGDRPARPERPDISLGEESGEEVVIEIETPDTGVEIPDAEVKIEVPETRQSRRERRRNRNKVNEDITIEQPEEPSVEIVVGDNVEIELPEEIVVEQPETPEVEVEVEIPETPEVEIEVEQPETPIVEIEVETPEVPEVEIEVEQPEMPEVKIEVEQPEIPAVTVETEQPAIPETPEVEIATPEAPEIEIEAATPEVAVEAATPEVEEVPKKPLTRRDRKRMRRNPPDINKDIDIDSEAAKVSEEVMAEVPQEPVEEVVEEVEISVEETSEEIAVEMPEANVETPKPASRPTREGVLDPKITSQSSINFGTAVEAREAYDGFYVPFEDEAYYVTKELYTELDGLIRTMNRFPSLRVTLQGHTTEQEGVSFVHQEITRKRVHYIQNYLVTKGVALNRIGLNFFDDISNINEENKQRVNVIFE